MTTAPDLIEHVIGYRGWRLRRDGRLVSAGAGRTVWKAGVNTAVCNQRRKHAAPDGQCACGLHAFHDLPPAASPGMVGAVRAHGNVECHHAGFRAQHAEIVALVQRGRRPRRRELRASAIYQVPLVCMPELQRTAAPHGSVIAHAQRPVRRREDLFSDVPALRAVSDQLERAYDRIAGALRRRPWLRSLLLSAITYGPLMTLLMWGYMAAVLAADGSPSAAVFWLSCMPAMLSVAAVGARRLYGSHWLRPAQLWVGPALLLLGVPLQFAAAVGVQGLGVETLKWTVGLMAVNAVLAGFACWEDLWIVVATIGWVTALLVVGPLLPQYVLLLVMTAALAQYATLYFTSARVVGPRRTA